MDKKSNGGGICPPHHFKLDSPDGWHQMRFSTGICKYCGEIKSHLPNATPDKSTKRWRTTNKGTKDQLVQDIYL